MTGPMERRSRNQVLRVGLVAISTLCLVAPKGAFASEIRGDFVWGTSETASQATPSILDVSSASFSWQGVTYSLYATNGPGLSAQEVLEGSIPEIAPGIDLHCFYRFSAGSWDDLAVAGLSDPRVAIPPSFREVSLEYFLFAPPAPACQDVVAPGPLPVLLSAVFEDPSGRRLEIRAAGSQTPAPEEPGSLAEASAEWRHGNRSFSIVFYGPGFGEGVTAAIAKALDPTFDEGCQRRLHDLSDTEVATYGFRLPAVPAGFKLLSRKQEARLSSGCSKRPADSGLFDLAWVYTSKANLALEIGASRGGAASASETHQPLLGDDYVRWTNDQGTTYYVYGHSLDDGPGMNRADLFAVARSLDPAVQLPQP